MSRVLLRRGTAAQWAAANPVLFLGEPAIETDTHKLRVGDGTNHFLDLPVCVLRSNDFISNTKVKIDSVEPSSPPPGSIWILCESGGSFATIPSPPLPVFFRGTVDFAGEGTVVLVHSPQATGSVSFSGTGTLGAH